MCTKIVNLVNILHNSAEHTALNSERCARNSEHSEHKEQNSALSERSALNSEPSFHQHDTNFQSTLLYRGPRINKTVNYL